jgi:hypothetical protein
MLKPEAALKISTTTQNYISEISPQIEGWFYPVDMMLFAMTEAFHQSISASGDIAEIGVWKGKSLALLAMLADKSECIYAMDLFFDDLLQQTQSNISTFTTPEQSARIQYVTGNTADYSTDYLRTLFKNKLRFLHIDAGHEYHEVLHTLTLTAPFMHDYGIISMDDYHDREFPGVHAATLDYCYETTKGLWVPFLAGGNKIYLANPVYAKQFQLFLCKEAYFRDSMRLSRIKDSIVLIIQSKLPMKSEVIQHIIEQQLNGLKSAAELNELTQKARHHSQTELAALQPNN